MFRDKRQKRELAAAVDRSRKLLMAGRHEENFELLERAVLQFPSDPEIRVLWATTLFGAPA